MDFVPPTNEDTPWPVRCGAERAGPMALRADSDAEQEMRCLTRRT